MDRGVSTETISFKGSKVVFEHMGPQIRLPYNKLLCIIISHGNEMLTIF